MQVELNFFHNPSLYDCLFARKWKARQQYLFIKGHCIGFRCVQNAAVKLQGKLLSAQEWSGLLVYLLNLVQKLCHAICQTELSNCQTGQANGPRSRQAPLAQSFTSISDNVWSQFFLKGSGTSCLCNNIPTGLDKGTSKHKWVAPCKPAPNDYFVAIFQVAPNRLKFGMSTLFVLKNVPVGFFSLCQINPPPPLYSSPNNVEFRSLRAKTLSFTLLEGDWGGGCKKVGGGELSRMCLKSCFPACGKKKDRNIF